MLNFLIKSVEVCNLVSVRASTLYCIILKTNLERYISHLGSIAVLLRGVKLVSKCCYQSATRCSNSLPMHLGSPLKTFVKIC